MTVLWNFCIGRRFIGRLIVTDTWIEYDEDGPIQVVAPRWFWRPSQRPT